MIGTRRALLWVALAIPAALMIQRFASGEALAMDLYHPSGEMAVRLMILALLPGPLADALGHSRFLRGWLAIRRNFGVAAFLYALLHLVFYVLDMRMIAAMLNGQRGRVYHLSPNGGGILEHRYVMKKKKTHKNGAVREYIKSLQDLTNVKLARLVVV